LVPAYFDPGQSAADWQTLSSAAGKVPLVAIANPSNGPGNQVNSAYTQAISALQAQTGRVIGYVHTSYGTRALADVEADITNWYLFYPNLKGIFLDEMAQTATTANLNYYQQITAFIRNKSASSLIVANPGGAFDEAFIKNNVADVFVINENPATTLNAEPEPTWIANYAPQQFAQIATASSNEASETLFLAHRHLGWIYATAEPWQPNPYSKLTKDFSAEVDAIVGLNARTQNPSTNTMCFGLGDRFNWMVDNTTSVATASLSTTQGFPVENQLNATWLTQGWDNGYLLNIQDSINQGIVPVIIYYYAGDLSQYGNNAWAHVQSIEADWLNDAKRLGQALSTLQGTVIVVLQPEWNIPTLQDNAQFGSLLAQIGSTIAQSATTATSSSLRLRIGTAVGDFGTYTLTTDPNWSKFDPAMQAAAPNLDFIGFQEMRAALRRNAQGGMDTVSSVEEGLSQMPERMVNFSAYLKITYNKPVFIPYVTIATYTPSGDPDNWETLSAGTYQAVLAQAGNLQQAGAFGVMAMSLFDEKSHNNGNTDYFGDASTTYGLVYSNGATGSALIGQPPYQTKAAGLSWINGTKAVATHNAVCAIP
jgi:hypothetical protein